MKKVTVRVRKYDLIRQAVEGGCAYASHRFFKHLDLTSPLETIDRERLAEVFVDAVMGEICEIVDFEDELT